MQTQADGLELYLDGTKVAELTLSGSEEKAGALWNASNKLLFVSKLVADIYEAEQLRGNFPGGQTWHTIDHVLGQAARAAVSEAERGA